MDVADIIIEDFLYQNAFSDHDYFCPLPKSVSHLRLLHLYVYLFGCLSACPSDWLTVCLAGCRLVRQTVSQLVKQPVCHFIRQAAEFI